jgi:hypothetical protein
MIILFSVWNTHVYVLDQNVLKKNYIVGKMSVNLKKFV